MIQWTIDWMVKEDVKEDTYIKPSLQVQVHFNPRFTSWNGSGVVVRLAFCDGEGGSEWAVFRHLSQVIKHVYGLSTRGVEFYFILTGKENERTNLNRMTISDQRQIWCNCSVDTTGTGMCKITKHSCVSIRGDDRFLDCNANIRWGWRFLDDCRLPFLKIRSAYVFFRHRNNKDFPHFCLPRDRLSHFQRLQIQW